VLVHPRVPLGHRFIERRIVECRWRGAGLDLDGAARPSGGHACRRGSAPKPPDWNTRTSFSRIISSSARKVTIMSPRVAVLEEILEAAGLGSESRASSCSMRSSIDTCSGGSGIGGRFASRARAPAGTPRAG
jgi:hypothetical protein